MLGNLPLYSITKFTTKKILPQKVPTACGNRNIRITGDGAIAFTGTLSTTGQWTPHTKWLATILGVATENEIHPSCGSTLTDCSLKLCPPIRPCDTAVDVYSFRPARPITNSTHTEPTERYQFNVTDLNATLCWSTPIRYDRLNRCSTVSVQLWPIWTLRYAGVRLSVMTDWTNAVRYQSNCDRFER